MIPWLPDAIKTAVTVAIYALYDFFNAAGKFIVDAYNEYAIFTLHVVIIALYGKQLFSKEIKAKYHASLKTINDYKNVVLAMLIISKTVITGMKMNISNLTET